MFFLIIIFVFSPLNVDRTEIVFFCAKNSVFFSNKINPTLVAPTIKGGSSNLIFYENSQIDKAFFVAIFCHALCVWSLPVFCATCGGHAMMTRLIITAFYY